MSESKTDWKPIDIKKGRLYQLQTQVLLLCEKLETYYREEQNKWQNGKM